MRKILLLILTSLMTITSGMPSLALGQPPAVKFMGVSGQTVTQPLWGQVLIAEVDVKDMDVTGVFLSLALYDKTPKAGKPSGILADFAISTQPESGKLRSSITLPDDPFEKYEIKATLWGGFGNMTSLTSAALLSSNEARLKRLKINGIDVAGFSPDVTEYQLEELDESNPPTLLTVPMDGGAAVTPVVNYAKQNIKISVAPSNGGNSKVYTLAVPFRIKNYVHLFNDSEWTGGLVPASFSTTGLAKAGLLYSDKATTITSIDPNNVFGGANFLKDYTVIRPAYSWVAETRTEGDVLNPQWYGQAHVEWFKFTVDRSVEVMILSPQWQLPDWVYDYKWIRDPANPGTPTGKQTNYTWDYPEGSKPGARWTIDEWSKGIYLEAGGSQFAFMAKKVFTIPEGQTSLEITMRSPGVPKSHSDGKIMYPPEAPKRQTPYIVLVKPI